MCLGPSQIKFCWTSADAQMMTLRYGRVGNHGAGVSRTPNVCNHFLAEYDEVGLDRAMRGR